MKRLVLLMLTPLLAGGGTIEDHEKEVEQAAAMLRQIYLSQAVEDVCMYAPDPWNEYYLMSIGDHQLRINCGERNAWVLKYRAGKVE